MVMPRPRPRPAGPISVGVKIFQTEGLAALFSRVAATILRHTLYSMTRMGLYEIFRGKWSDPNTESFRASIAGGHMAHDRVVGAHSRVGVNEPSALRDGNGEALQADGDDLDVGIFRDQNKGPKINLMEQNSTAHAVEWNDFIDNSNKGSPKRPHLPSPEKESYLASKEARI